MQSPLTPQRGRIESNPREYTHMGPRHCSELKTMPADWVALSVRPSHEQGFSDARCSRVEIRTHERGNSDARQTTVENRTHERGKSDACLMTVDFRTKSAAKCSKTVQISTLIFQPSNNPRSCIARVSLISHSSLIREITERREIITRDNGVVLEVNRNGIT